MSAKPFLPSSTSSATFFRALRTASCSRSCAHTLRNMSYSAQAYQSSKRELYTAPSYQPHNMPDFPLPPRNTGVPDTSIAGPQPQLKENKSQKVDSRALRDPTEAASISLPEGEAQQSRTVTPAQTRPSSLTTSSEQKTEQKTEAKPRRKLRARKAAVTITAPALNHLRSLLSQPEPKMIRIGVRNRGCSGLAYDLSYVETAGKFDEVIEQEGVKVLIDSKALFSIIGSEMDWEEDKLSARFVFKNPNITEQCGCGESFSVS